MFCVNVKPVKYFLIAIFLLLANKGMAQVYAPVTGNKLAMQKTTGKIKVDGLLTETAWNNAAKFDSLYNKWPKDQGKAAYQTEVKMTYDDDNLYVAFKAYVNKEPVIQTLKRDGSNYWLGDGVMVLIDALNQRAQALAFAINAGGAQSDGIMQPNIGISWDWDGKWYSAVNQFEGYYTGEMAIPFQTLRFKEGQNEWGINIIRNDMATNSFSTWTNVPVAFPGVDLGYLGTLQFADKMTKAKANRVIIPYTTATVKKDYKENTPAQFKPGIGADAKIALNSSLNLDLTLNPDFSQADVDRQVINTDRFSLFFPERRNFFLENSDLFANFGREGIRPFFSRKIGIGEGGKQLPIIGGARLTGNITKDVRIGLLNMQTDKYEDLSPQNYTVASVEKRILKRSNIKALFTNRQTTGHDDKTKTVDDVTAAYNRVGGGEFNYLSNDSRYAGSVKYFRSFNPGINNETDYFNAGGEYSSKNWWIMSNINKVGKNFITDAGFVPRLYNYDAGADTTVRLGFTGWNSFVQYRIFPKKNKKINMMLFDIVPALFWNRDGSLNEAGVQLNYRVLYADRKYLQINFQSTSINLPFETELFKNTGHLLPQHYSYHSGRVDFFSDIRKPLSWNISAEAGSFYNGGKYTFSGGMNKRVQPWGNFGVNFSQTFVELNNKKASISLISPMIELAFSPTMFWTTFLQYNTQAENFNINSRFQWRFKPMSDLFVVYTDNYFTDGIAIKNRSLVVKLNYWLNW
jgi:Domain of unknown function (DUF5916)/Carbohydrate family 9 binding domain-like